MEPKILVDSGKLERSARGVYILPELWDDEMYNLQVQFKRGIFSGETALFLNDLTDRTSNRYQMIFPIGYNVTSLKIDMRNDMKLKSIIKNISKEKGISTQLVMQNFMLEKLLERISISKYLPHFIYTESLRIEVWEM